MTTGNKHDETIEIALLSLLKYLNNIGYVFVTPTPSTHAIIIERGQSYRPQLTDVLGWNVPFARGSIDPIVEDLLHRADAIEASENVCRSRVRVSSLNGDLFVHSAYPTSDADAVFFGPDSYRFADLITRELAQLSLPDDALIVDIGTGSGVGAVVAARIQPRARVAMTDLNANALRLATINAKAAGLGIEACLGSELASLTGPVSVAMANPPYIIDSDERLYRDGGGALGGDVSLRMAQAALDRLGPKGRLILYTGSAISGGRDAFHDDMVALAQSVGAHLRYREIDPDVFGEELRNPAYAAVDRIAVVAAIVEMP